MWRNIHFAASRWRHLQQPHLGTPRDWCLHCFHETWSKVPRVLWVNWVRRETRDHAMHSEKRWWFKPKFGGLELFNLFLDGVGKVILKKPVTSQRSWLPLFGGNNFFLLFVSLSLFLCLLVFLSVFLSVFHSFPLELFFHRLYSYRSLYLFAQHPQAPIFE